MTITPPRVLKDVSQRVPVAPTVKPTSVFVSGQFPRRRWLVVLAGLLGGLALAYAWSSDFADKTIGFGVADQLLGHDADTTPIGGIGSGILFALVSGLAGSFTACNIAVFGAVGPLLSHATSRRDRFVQTVKPLGYLAIGMIPVSAIYGAIVGIFGTKMPQFQLTATHGLSPRIIQAMITFGAIGLVMLVLGLASLGILRDPLAAVSRRFPNAGMVLMGMLIGGFLIGRPYPLFRDMFRHAAISHNPFYGAAAFVLQSVGNILVMSVLFVLVSYLVGRPLARWMSAKPSRAATLTAAAFLFAAAFMLIYWDVRLLGVLGYLWFPVAPWS